MRAVGLCEASRVRQGTPQVPSSPGANATALTVLKDFKPRNRSDAWTASKRWSTASVRCMCPHVDNGCALRQLWPGAEADQDTTWRWLCRSSKINKAVTSTIRSHPWPGARQPLQRASSTCPCDLRHCAANPHL
jgi:hypothetical protein